MGKNPGHSDSNTPDKRSGKNQQVRNLPVRDPYIETAVANPERVDNGALIYRGARAVREYYRAMIEVEQGRYERRTTRRTAGDTGPK